MKVLFTSILVYVIFLNCAAAHDTKESCYSNANCYSVAVGSSDVDSSRLKPYHAKWTQNTLQDGEWVKGDSSFEEYLKKTPDGNWQHIQISDPGNGQLIVTGSRTLASQTLQVLDLTAAFDNKPDGHPVKIFLDLTGDEYVQAVTLDSGEVKHGAPNDLPIPMFDGQILGITIAALPLGLGYKASLPALLAHNSSSYSVDLEVTRQTTIKTADGDTQDVWEVATKWIDHSTGSVSAAGRNESGGAYYIAINPESEVPHVIEYTNTGTSIVWDGVDRAE